MLPTHDDKPEGRPSLLATWFWFILKNVVGWVLILSSFPLGAFIPGPGGIPLFLIGFGLITFPGKRRIVARLLRGVPIRPGSWAFRIAVIVIALLLPAVLMFYLEKLGLVPRRYDPNLRGTLTPAYIVSAVLLGWAGLKSLPLVNRLIAKVPDMRRRVRPWLRHKGIDLLPPRRRRRRREADPEILEIHERHFHRMRETWTLAKPWVRRLLGLAITVAIFVWIFKPIVREWDAVSARVATIRWSRFILASVMFAGFLFTFRAMVWRRILIHFGHRLPVASAVRIWSSSELARYLPGVIWQVVGRAYLASFYGVRRSHCSASQILELTIFLLANLLVALACLVWLGIKQMDGVARAWMFAAMAIVPVLIFLLHPRVLYRLMNGILRRLGKPPLEPNIGFAELAGLLLWTIVGLLFQSLAIWLLVEEPLGGLQLAKWWVVAGAYCLAWCAGFLAFWAPGGLGVRELVFVAALRVALPPAVRHRFDSDPQQLVGIIMFLSVLLRLWATTGEFILTGIAYALDWKGAFRRRERLVPSA
jgi:hypothetical protein